MTKDANPAFGETEAQVLACEVVANMLGGKPANVEYQAAGASNYVFRVSHSDGDFVVRVAPSQSKLESFMKEKWAVSKAREVMIPTAEVLAVGGYQDHPFTIARMVSGKEATHHPERRRILEQLGRYARIINSIPTSGFGKTFDWSNVVPPYQTWDEFLVKEIELERRLIVLRDFGMLNQEQIGKIRSILTQIGNQQPRAWLCHGDLRLKNTIVSDDGKIVALLDWENCISSIAPAWDLAIALHDLSIDEKQNFLDGYALSEQELAATACAIKALNIIHYAARIETPDGTDDQNLLLRWRIRLAGMLDLYSL